MTRRQSVIKQMKQRIRLEKTSGWRGVARLRLARGV
jgi:hypothetical protein